MGAQSGLTEDRFQPNAARYDQADPAPVGLAAPPQPAHECVRRRQAFRRDAVLVTLQQAVDQYGQFVDGQHDRPVVGRKGLEYVIANALPATGVQTRAQPHAKLGDAQFLNIVADVPDTVSQHRRQPSADALQRPRLGGHFGDCVRQRP